MGSPPRTVRSREIGFNDGLAHVAIVTRDGFVLTLYVDGQSTRFRIKFRTSRSTTSSSARVVFRFAGDIPEIRLYRGSLLASGSWGPDPGSAHDLSEPPSHSGCRHLRRFRGPTGPHFELRRRAGRQQHRSRRRLTCRLSPHRTLCTVRFELQGDGAFVYVPAQGFAGLDSFTYEVFDGTHRRQADVTLEILDKTDLPRSIANVYWLQTDAAFTVGASDGVLSNDWHPDQLALSAQIVQSTANGDLQLRSDGSFQYRPKPGFVGTDHFRYLATDGTNTSTPVEVQLIVQAGTVAISGWRPIGLASDEDRKVLIGSNCGTTALIRSICEAGS